MYGYNQVLYSKHKSRIKILCIFCGFFSETCQIDLAILLDKSGSIVENNQPQNWDLVINFTKQAISMVKENAGSNIALITFGNAYVYSTNLEFALVFKLCQWGTPDPHSISVEL